MSLLKSIKAQLGLSNTATQNFTLTAEAADGTMKLARGNAGATTQDIITVDAAGKVAFPQNSGGMTLGTKQTASGNTLTFSSIPSWVKKVTLSLSGLSSTGTGEFAVKIGPVAGVESSGYSGSVGIFSGAGTSAANLSTGFIIFQNSQGAAYTTHGQMVLTLIDAATNLWAASCTAGESDASRLQFMGGSKAIAGVLSVLTLSTTDTFDAGSVNILYEG